LFGVFSAIIFAALSLPVSHADLFSHWKHFFTGSNCKLLLLFFFFVICAATATTLAFVSFWFEKYLAYFIGQHSSRRRSAGENKYFPIGGDFLQFPAICHPA